MHFTLDLYQSSRRGNATASGHGVWQTQPRNGSVRGRDGLAANRQDVSFLGVLVDSHALATMWIGTLSYLARHASTTKAFHATSARSALARVWPNLGVSDSADNITNTTTWNVVFETLQERFPQMYQDALNKTRETV